MMDHESECVLCDKIGCEGHVLAEAGPLEARIDDLERQLAVEQEERKQENARAWAVYAAMQTRALDAERQLAKTEAAHINLRANLHTLEAHANGVADEAERWCTVAAEWKERAEAAERRVAELLTFGQRGL